MRTPDEVAHMSIAVCCHDEPTFALFDTDEAARAIQADRHNLVEEIVQCIEEWGREEARLGHHMTPVRTSEAIADSLRRMYGKPNDLT